MAGDRGGMPPSVSQVTARVGCAPNPSAQQVDRIAVLCSSLLGSIVGLAGSADPIAAIVLRELAPTANKLDAELRDAGYLPERKPS